MREFVCVALSAFYAFILSFCQTLFIYYLGIYTNVSFALITLTMLSFFAIVVFICDRRNKEPEAFSSNPYWFDELSLVVCIHFAFLLIIVFYNPVFIVSKGFHKPIGPCEEKTLFNQLPFSLVFLNKIKPLNTFRISKNQLIFA